MARGRTWRTFLNIPNRTWAKWGQKGYKTKVSTIKFLMEWKFQFRLGKNWIGKYLILVTETTRKKINRFWKVSLEGKNLAEVYQFSLMRIQSSLKQKFEKSTPENRAQWHIVMVVHVGRRPIMAPRSLGPRSVQYFFLCIPTKSQKQGKYKLVRFRPSATANSSHRGSKKLWL